jgi:CBS domain-containing protein
MTGSPPIVSGRRDDTYGLSVGRDAPFKEIVRVMRECRTSAVPVMQVEGQVIGVVSEADLLHKEEFQDSDPTSPTRPRLWSWALNSDGRHADRRAECAAGTVRP